MILDQLRNATLYEPVHPGLEPAFAFLRRADLPKLEDGRVDLDGQRLYAIVARTTGRGRDQSPLETHDRFIDVQYVVEGADHMGWRHRSVTLQSRGYDREKDLELYDTHTTSYVEVKQGHFAVFFPHDAHAPLAGQGTVHKVVVKVRVEW
ncbi:MAG: YhcH/YjgK/YiaL family protein [Myxococcota bacterium]|nr:YhcH/YjgK/YiaL family protein [Myxococcota bacterium]